jgi:DNA-binding NtrC family response regulator
MERVIETVPTETMDTLVNWSWPGDLRELENFIERSVILTEGSALHASLAELKVECHGSVECSLEKFVIRTSTRAPIALCLLERSRTEIHSYTGTLIKDQFASVERAEQTAASRSGKSLSFQAA